MITLAATAAHAASLTDLKPLPYDCRISMSVDDGTPLFEKTFVAQADGGSHGGDGAALDAGGGYTIEYVADARWMDLSWSKAGTTIAKGVVAWNQGDAVHRAFLLYDPKNDANLVTMNCSRQDPK